METEEKRKQLKQLWKDLSQDIAPTQNIKKRKGAEVDVGFVNQFSLHENIPNKWFDWERRADAKIMIIGQDWGPYKSLLPYVTEYEKRKNNPHFDFDEYLFETASSRTEKFIVKTIEETFFEKFGTPITKVAWDNFIFTVAVFFTRQGKHFRGSEFYDEKFGVKLSLPYLKRQIEIVKPQIIMPLGGTAWNMIRNIFSLDNYPLSITEVTSQLKCETIKAGETTIIPNFHPASYTDPKIQYRIWQTIWEHLN